MGIRWWAERVDGAGGIYLKAAKNFFDDSSANEKLA
jgi:hypothetical protein